MRSYRTSPPSNASRWAIAIGAAAASLLAPARAELAAARAAPSFESPPSPLPSLESWELDNGLRVAHMRRRHRGAVTVQVWYRVGSKDEPRDRRGLAQVVQRLMFHGSERVRPGYHSAYIAALGGYADGFSGEDATAFRNTVPAAHWEFALELEAERMRHLLFRQQAFDAARRETIRARQQLGLDPVQRGFWRFLAAVFTKHPYAWDASGDAGDLDKTVMAEARSFYDRYYLPNNALVVVVGDLDAAAVKTAVARWFGALRRGPEPPRPAEPEPAQQGTRRRVLEPDRVGLVFAGYPIPGARHPDISALQVLGWLMGFGHSSRLAARLVAGDSAILQAGAPMVVREHPGILSFYAAHLPERETQSVEAALVKEIEQLGAEGPSPKEVARAKNQILTSWFFGLEDVTSLGNQIGLAWSLTADPGHFLADVTRFAAVTREEVARVAQTYVTGDKRTVVVVPPASAAGPGEN